MRAKSILRRIGAMALAAGVMIGALASSQQPAKAATGFKVADKKYEKSYQLDDGSDYYKLTYQYPVLKGNSAAAKKINQTLEKQRKEWIKKTKTNADKYKSEYEEYLTWAGKNDRAWTYSDDVSYEITNNDGKYFSVLISGYEYTGGAHGMPYRIAYTFDAKTGQKLTAAKLLKTSKAKLNEKVRKLYLKKYDKEGIDAGFYASVEGDKNSASGRTELKKALAPMDFNNAFYVKDGKAVFYAEPYVLGPYAAGYIEVYANVK